MIGSIRIKNKIQIKAAITLFLIFIIGISLGMGNLNNNAKRLSANKGVLDLSKWDFNSRGAVELSGEWEFYWKRLVNAKSSLKPDTYVSVPSVWNSYKIYGKKLTPFGYATYRLHVKGNFKNQLAIKIQNCSTAYELYIDNKLIAQNGIVTKDSKRFVPEYKLQSKTFIVSKHEFTITVHIANYVYSKGGMWYASILGKPSQIQEINRFSEYRDLFLIGSFISMILFSLCIFILGENNPVILFFILLTSMVTLRTSIYGERIFEKFISSFRITVIMQYITVIWVPILIALFLQSIIHNKKFTRFTSTAVVIAIIITLFILITPIETFTKFIIHFEVLGAGITIYSIIAIFFSKVQFRYIIAAGAIVFGVAGIHDMLYQASIINGYAELSPVGFYMMLNVWAVILANEYVTAIKEKTALMKKALDSEIAFLQAQIKPHFLYNSLNTIAALCRIDEIEAENLTIELSKYLQYTFDFKNLSKFIPFNNELDFIKTYVKIEKARFGDEFEIIYELCDTEDLMVPPLSIQPLIENAIRHGLRKKGEFGTVILKVYKKLKFYIIEVIDDGVGIQPELLEKINSKENLNNNGVGIMNVKFRIEETYKTKFEIESMGGKGTKITIIVPMEVKQ